MSLPLLAYYVRYNMLSFNCKIYYSFVILYIFATALRQLLAPSPIYLLSYASWLTLNGGIVLTASHLFFFSLLAFLLVHVLLRWFNAQLF